MMKRQAAQLPLHGGKAPRWLFERMTKLAGAVTMAIVDEYGPSEMLRRLSDPWWFQAFGCVLGFDWHSSGVTTVTCGALKSAYQQLGPDLGIVVAGGKGATGRKTPAEIEAAATRFSISGGDKLIYASRMSAKVDSAAIQDGYQIYQHAFFFTPRGDWCVVQQGMNERSSWARRYHWLGEHVDDFVCEPHAAIQNLSDIDSDDAADRLPLLNMVASEAEESRTVSASLACENPDRLLAEIDRLTEGPTLFAPARHRIIDQDVNLRSLRTVLVRAHERQPQNFETLLGTAGVGPAAVRSLALLAEIVHGVPMSRRDPGESESGNGDCSTRRWADFAYAHGGKDGHPFPVDRTLYDRNIEVLSSAVRRARLGETEKRDAWRRLAGRSS
ncbi:MAG TPA: DUF763 domain-containing protein [Planctomycetaceae bacterium]|nr:DUF763 domain-containing protein [Planctomycetaceae bacterium]